MLTETTIAHKEATKVESCFYLFADELFWGENEFINCYVIYIIWLIIKFQLCMCGGLGRSFSGKYQFLIRPRFTTRFTHLLKL